MTRIITVPGADASGRGLPAIDLSTFAREIGRIPGLIHFIDPLSVPGYAVNGTPVTAFADRVRGRPLRADPAQAPVMATEAGVAGGRTLLDVSGISECTLTAQDATFPADGAITFVGMFRPVPASIDGSVTPFLLRAIEGVTGRLSFLITAGANPALLLRDDTLNTGVAWPLDETVRAAIPFIAAFTINPRTGGLALYINDGSSPVAAVTVAQVVGYPKAHFTFGGAKLAVASWRGRFGRQLMWNRVLTSVELRTVMQQFRDYYGVLV
jgi:hypothetical protein